MTVAQQQRPRAYGVVVAAMATGALVSVALGVYGSRHQPTGQVITTLGFGSLFAMKVWLGVVAGVLGVVQLVSALWMYGKLGRPAPAAVRIVHRLSGATAVVVSLPVAYHCLWSLGFQTYDARVMAHSLFGCVFYGAFVTKIIALKTRAGPGWFLPIAAGLLLAALVVVVFTSSLWYLSNVGLPPSSGGY